MSSQEDSSGFIPLAQPKRLPNVRKIKGAKSVTTSLFSRCCAVAAGHLERYPIEAFAILDEESWESIIRMRHRSTAPAKGSGGLDGTGRMNPAVSAKLMADIEGSYPHLSESKVSDKLVWKDCVTYKFKEGGVSRPAGLMYPWPDLVARLQAVGRDLSSLLQADEATEGHKTLLDRSIKILIKQPLNVNLLQGSGVGKSVKKFIKECSSNQALAEILGANTEERMHNLPLRRGGPALSPLAQLEKLLHSWKSVAARSGQAKIASADESGSSLQKQEQNELNDLAVAETCQSWRALFDCLEEREMQRRADQGARMRERRRNVDSTRRQIARVRPKNPRHEAILNRPHEKKRGYSQASPSVATNDAGSKLMKLRQETAFITGRRGPAPTAPKKGSSNFGTAVALSQTGSSGLPIKRKAVKAEVVAVGLGKRIKLPSMVPVNGARGKLKPSLMKKR